MNKKLKAKLKVLLDDAIEVGAALDSAESGLAEPDLIDEQVALVDSDIADAIDPADSVAQVKSNSPLMDAISNSLVSQQSLAAMFPETSRLAPPQIGFYHDIDFDVYRRWDAMNSSTIDWGLNSMEHMKASWDGKLSKSSKALDFGRAIHCKLLEPDQFKNRYLVLGPCAAKLKSGDRKGQSCCANGVAFHGGEWYCSRHSEESWPCPDALTPGQISDILAIEEKVKSHDVVKLLRSLGGFEASAIWSWNGLPCKFRADKIVYENASVKPVIIDVKKVSLGRCSDRAVVKSIEDYNYHMKAAFYVDGAKYILNAEEVNFIWVFVEDSYPFSINVVQADDVTLQIGRSEYERVLRDWMTCLEAGHYPGCSYSQSKKRDAIKLGGVSDWTRKKFGFIR